MKRILTTLLALVTIAMTAGAQTKEAYAVVSTDGTTLTFYYDTQKAAREGTEGTTCPIPWNGDLPGWWGISTITKADFDISFDDYHGLTTAGYMFNDMDALTAINNIDRLHTENVTSMYCMFAYCSSLKEIDLSHLDTRNVETMFGMFEQDKALTTLDVNGFDVTNVTNMEMMFCGCSNLTTIYCEKNWDTGNVSNSRAMFTGCEKLVGATAYVPSQHDVLYANPTDGYFTLPPEPYAVVSTDGKTLTFYYDTNKDARTGTVYSIPWTDEPGWYGNSTITSVSFTSSFKKYTGLTSTKNMFSHMEKLESFAYDDLSYINTANVTDMSYMFSECKALKRLNFTGLNTASATNMAGMCSGNSSLATIYGLAELNTGNVTNMSYMFSDCSSLVMLDMSGFNTQNVNHMEYMFYNCPSLTTIYCPNTWPRASYSEGMFLNDNQLVGAIAYDGSKTDGNYANPNYGYFTGKAPYAVLDGSTLTFYYDNQMPTDGTVIVYKQIPWSSMPEWQNNRNITTVDFDESFADYTGLNNTSFMFYNLTSLQSVNHLDRLNTTNVIEMRNMFRMCNNLTNLDVTSLNTEKVTSMERMFADCHALTELDVSSFNTKNVTNMSYMFAWCKALTSLDLSNFNTENVTDMNNMFATCNALTTLDVSNFNTENVTNMSSMFSSCFALTDLDVSNFNTAKVKYMSSMFSICSSLTKLDVSNFNMESVTSMASMFSGCKNLTTIYCDKDWYKQGLAANQMSGMFGSCNSLVGGNGTIYDASHTDATYAHPDAEGNPGYFTKKLEPYAVVSTDNTALTFYYDGKKDKREGIVYPIPWSGEYPGWYNSSRVEEGHTITTATFDESFKDYDGLKSAKNMFYNMMILTEINNLDYLNTSNVENMYSMFSDCRALESLDLSSFVTDKVTNMLGMFGYCESLRLLDVSHFNMEKVTNMWGMFINCSNLTTIYCSRNWQSSNVSDSERMFYGCASLMGGNGTVYNSSHIDATYAHPDVAGNPGYFTSNAYAVLNEGTLTFYYDRKEEEREGTKYTLPWNEGSFPGWAGNPNITTIDFDESFANYDGLTSTFGMFFQVDNLTTINNLERLNTQNVSNMAMMFGYIPVETLNLMNLNTEKVTDMSNMFSNCSKLTTIYCNKQWNCSQSEGMFSGCTKLVGGNGTKCSEAQVYDVTYARPDKADCPGYFTLPLESYAVLSTNGKTLTFYYDTEKDTRTGTVYCIPWTDRPEWYGSSTITTVDFTDSYRNYTGLTSTKNMFSHMEKLETFNGMENLNTANVTDMSYMFTRCDALKTIDVSHLNTVSATNMMSMFSSNSNLKQIYGLSNFNTSNVTDMSYMFSGCFSLHLLDVSSFNTQKVTHMEYMFYNCPSLTTIQCANTWPKARYSTGMFLYDEQLVGAIAYDGSKTDGNYANPTSGYFTDKMPYAVLSDDGKTLTFYYDKLKSTRTERTYSVPWADLPEWFSFSGITTVDFDSSFSNYKGLTSTHRMFCHLQDLETINGIHNLNTENVTDMSDMFSYCPVLKTIDVSKLNTASVTDMSSMFCYDTNLQQIWGLSNFNTANVTNMGYMFAGCSSLVTLDVSSFNTQKVTIIASMFSNCTSLTTIYCANTWRKPNYSSRMFENDYQLVGAIAYDSSKTDGSYANPTSGYFTVPTNEPYAVLSTDGTTLTFYYDWKKNERGEIEGTTYPIPNNGNPPRWAGSSDATSNTTITTVTFHESFKDYNGLRYASYMFANLEALTTINHLEYLKTDNVVDMSYMFANCNALKSLDLTSFNTGKVTYMGFMFNACTELKSLDISNFDTSNLESTYYMFFGCHQLESLDVSHFNTEKVTEMGSMFGCCYALTSLDVSHFNTEKVTNMGSMFYCCYALTSLDLSNFNTANVTNMYGMFFKCIGLTSLDVSNFNTANVTSMSSMFKDCHMLQTIYCNADWSKGEVSNSSDMFSGCNSLVGGNGTKCSEALVYDVTYAHPDVEDNPGYFTRNAVRGDVNSDNHVDVADVTALVNILATNDTMGDAYVTYDVAVKPTSDYLIATIDLDSSVLGALQSALQLSPSELAEKIVNNSSEELGNDEARFMPVDASGNLVYKVHTGSSGYGYWLNANGEWIGWGVDAYVDVELAYNNGKWQISLNQYPGHNHSGDNVTARLALVYKNAQGKMGTTWFTFNYLFDDAAANTVTLKYVVKPEIPADVNLDGSVTRADVTDLVNIILEK